MIATELKNHRAKLKQNMNSVERWLFEHSYAGYNLRAFLYGRDHRLLGIGRKKFLPTLKSDLTYRYKKFTQRGKRGFADSDLWNLDSYILSWLPEALNQLAETTHSYPGRINLGKEDEDITYTQWTTLLNEIAAQFEEMRVKLDSLGSLPEKEDYEEFYANWNKLGRVFFSLWD